MRINSSDIKFVQLFFLLQLTTGGKSYSYNILNNTFYACESMSRFSCYGHSLIKTSSLTFLNLWSILHAQTYYLKVSTNSNLALYSMHIINLRESMVVNYFTTKSWQQRSIYSRLDIMTSISLSLTPSFLSLFHPLWYLPTIFNGSSCETFLNVHFSLLNVS